MLTPPGLAGLVPIRGACGGGHPAKSARTVTHARGPINLPCYPPSRTKCMGILARRGASRSRQSASRHAGAADGLSERRRRRPLGSHAGRCARGLVGGSHMCVRYG
jgi:hypothetical protein